MPNAKPKVAILGAGMTGLSAANHLVDAGFDVRVFEQQDRVGGLAKDCSRDGFTVDLGPHYIFDSLARKVGVENRVKQFPYYEELFRKGRFYTFPFGMMKNPRYFYSVGSAYALNLVRKRNFKDLDEALRKNYGYIFKNEVLAPLLSKWSGAHPKDLSMELSTRLEPANLDQILFFVKKLVFRVSPDFKQRNKIWVYPEGGIADLFKKLSSRKEIPIHLNERVERIEVEGNRVKNIRTDRGSYEADYVVSSLPINQLANYVTGSNVFQPYTALKFRPVVFYFMRYRRDSILNKLWTWFPEEKYSFYRVSEPKKVFPFLGPKGETQLTLELACEEGDEVWNADPEKFAAHLNQQLCDAYGMDPKDFSGFYTERSKYVYPVYLKSYDDLRLGITYQSPIENMVWGGRVGQFKYIFLEECFEIGKKCAQLIVQKRNSSAAQVSEERSPFGREDAQFP